MSPDNVCETCISASEETAAGFLSRVGHGRSCVLAHKGSCREASLVAPAPGESHAGPTHASVPSLTAESPRVAFGFPRAALSLSGLRPGCRPPLAPIASISTISSSSHSLFRVLFIFPSRYLFAIGLPPLFSLRWSIPPLSGCTLKQPDSLTATLVEFDSSDPQGTITLCGAPFHATSGRKRSALGRVSRLQFPPALQRLWIAPKPRA